MTLPGLPSFSQRCVDHELSFKVGAVQDWQQRPPGLGLFSIAAWLSYMHSAHLPSRDRQSKSQSQ